MPTPHDAASLGPPDARAEDVALAVIELVDLVPAGQATTYGDLAELVGWGGPRRSAAVLASHGSMTHWWRVVRADGSLPEHLRDRALAHWRAEGTPTRESGSGIRVDLRRCRWAGPTADATGGGLSVPGASI